MREAKALKVSIFHRNWLGRNELARAIGRAARLYASGDLLDIGCGTKPYQELFEVDSYIGVDLPLSHDISRQDKKVIARSRAIDVHGSALALPFSDSAFQTVVSFQVLEHVPEPQQMLSEIARVLKEGGTLILSTPQMWHLHEAPHDYYRYTKYGLIYLFRQSRLKLVEITPIAGFWARVGLKLNYKLEPLINRLERLSPLLGCPFRLFVALDNLAFKALDLLWPNPEDCVNHFIVGKKDG